MSPRSPRARERRRAPSLAWALACALACACTPFKTDPVVDAGETADETELPPCDPTQPFGPAAVVAGLPSASATSVSGLRLSPDYFTAYFSEQGGPASATLQELYLATRSELSSPFEGTVPIIGGDLDTTQDETTDPTVSGDGRLLVFARFYQATVMTQIYTASRVDESTPFGNATLLPNVNSMVESDESPFLREDAAVLYFASNRVTQDGSDIYRAVLAQGAFGQPQAVSELNTQFNEIYPVVTPDDLTIYFASARPDGGAQGMLDVWTATRASPSEPFATVSNVAEVNSAADDLPTFVTRDDCTLYFASIRSGNLLEYVATRGGQGD